MAEIVTYSKILKDYKICVVVPTYNNGNTLQDVLQRLLNYTDQIIVVNDGSSDDTSLILEQFKLLDVITLEKNRGKGFALKTGFKQALALGFNYAISIDSDGQHFPEDLPSLLDNFLDDLNTILIGSRNMAQDGVPRKSSFGNRFSNFWFHLETGISLPDTQSGYRLYPSRIFKEKKFYTNKFEFEIEVLVRSAWNGYDIKPVPIRVQYLPKEERISHFRPFIDFVRISLLNTVLVLITFFYIKPRNLIRYLRDTDFKKVLKDLLLDHNETKFKVSAAVGFGIFMGLTPIWGFQMLVAVFLAHLFRLNKTIVLIASNISIPPMIPFILFLSYLTGGMILNISLPQSLETFVQLKTTFLAGDFYESFRQLGYSILQYVIGSLVFGLVCGSIAGLITYLVVALFESRKEN